MVDAVWVCVLIGAVLGFLSGLGVGGGTLLMLWLTAVAGMEPSRARGINLLFFLPAAAVSVFLRRKQGAVRRDLALPAILGGVVSAAVLALLSAGMDDSLLRRGFGLLLLVVGLKELCRS